MNPSKSLPLHFPPPSFAIQTKDFQFPTLPPFLLPPNHSIQTHPKSQSTLFMRQLGLTSRRCPLHHGTYILFQNKFLGASEKSIRELFSKAYQTAPSIVFIDEIDAIASKRENLQREMERRIVTQLLTCMDESHMMVKSSDKTSDTELDSKKSGYVLVIGATNRPDAVDAALRRPGRFDREIALGVPDENARADILSVLTQKLRLAGDFDLRKIAKATPGFVGADLVALANKAGNLAMKRIIDLRRSGISSEEEKLAEEWWKEPWSPEEMKNLNITMSDFEVTRRQ